MAAAVNHNVTIICQNLHRISQNSGSFYRNHSQNYGTLLILQLSIISVVSKLIDICLRPLGQSTIVSQIIGGILLGPSFLGRNDLFASTFFPIRGSMVLETAGVFGLIFFLFTVGVKMDPSSMLSPGRKAMTIGLSAFFFTLVLSYPFVLLLQKLVSMEPSLKTSLPLIAGSQSLTGFPVVACLLTELKILNTDVGRLALSSSVFSDLVGISITVVGLAFTGNKRVSTFTSFLAIIAAVGLLCVIVYIFRPLVRRMLSRSYGRKSVSDAFISIIFAFVLFITFSSELIGQHYVFGPLILGLVVPEGPPLGSALVYKVETLMTGFFYPAYLAVSGLKTNVFKISSQASWIVAAVVIFAGIIKIAAVMIPAKYLNIPIQEAFVLGLILNAKGIVELMVYNLWKGDEILTDQDFAVSIISVLLVTAVITPLIKTLYDPSKQFYSLVKSTIQHSKRESELRILLCLHNQDTVPTAMDLLEVSHASEESPVMVIVLILSELVGRSTPVLIEHQQPHCHLKRIAASTSQILNALRFFERHNEGCAAVESFTSISHYETMHGDICRVARDKRATIVILPFHKRCSIDGSIESANRNIQSLNIRVLEVAPCSVGILIDRGILRDHTSVITAGVTYRIGVLFIGGQDDEESVAYGSRMARHPCVDLTVIRFLLFGAENSKDRERDSDLINEYREANLGNGRFMIVEEVVKDGSGFATYLRKMGDRFDLLIVGMHHPESQILTGLGEWSECPELGVVGDMLASTDCGSRASVLVVQQQRVGGRVAGRNMQEKAQEKERLIQKVPRFAALKETWSIAMER